MEEEKEIQAENFIDKTARDQEDHSVQLRLSLDYLALLEVVLDPKDKTIHPDFRTQQ